MDECPVTATVATLVSDDVYVAVSLLPATLYFTVTVLAVPTSVWMFVSDSSTAREFFSVTQFVA